MGKKRIVTKGGEDAAQITEKITSATRSKGFAHKALEKGRVYIRASYNNTRLIFTDEKGDVICWASSGSLGFKGPKKATPYAASKVAEILLEKISKLGVKSVDVYIEGVGGGRQSALYTLATKGLNIETIRDITPVPHNGPKPPNLRRV
ncbi:MAG TPA: 30S ribosomal protein S11 [Candidatus Paceibacterota bacterium]|nr:30S ribosomal protein S11 [Candidatus Paceibacterota bacterium]